MWNVSFFFPSPFQVINVLLKISELKDLQNTHDTLVVEVQTLLDTHVHLCQRVQQPQPVERSLPPTASFPKFFTRLKSRPKTRARSNTVGFTTSDSPNVDSAPFDVTVAALQEAYNRFVEAFWSINCRPSLDTVKQPALSIELTQLSRITWKGSRISYCKGCNLLI